MSLYEHFHFLVNELVESGDEIFTSPERRKYDFIGPWRSSDRRASCTFPTGSEALCRRLKRDSIVMVSNTASLGDSFRCITLASKDDFGLQQWVVNIEKASEHPCVVLFQYNLSGRSRYRGRHQNLCTSRDQQAMSQDSIDGASIFCASKAGDILRVKELISRGVDVNGTNAYGCAPLHYAAKNAADLAMVVARGSDETTDDHSKVCDIPCIIHYCTVVKGLHGRMGAEDACSGIFAHLLLSKPHSRHRAFPVDAARFALRKRFVLSISLCPTVPTHGLSTTWGKPLWILRVG